MPRLTPPETTVKQAATMYRMGYNQAMTELYQDKPLRDLVYGYEYYTKRGNMKHGEYERGIADALAERINAARKQS